jgi:hypothetical protein
VHQFGAKPRRQALHRSIARFVNPKPLFLSGKQQLARFTLQGARPKSTVCMEKSDENRVRNLNQRR